MDDAERLRKAEDAANLARAEASVAEANAQLTRAKIQAEGKVIKYDWETGATTVEPGPNAAAARGTSVGGRRRGRVS